MMRMTIPKVLQNLKWYELERFPLDIGREAEHGEQGWSFAAVTRSVDVLLVSLDLIRG